MSRHSNCRTDSYFANIRDLFEKLEGVDEIMEDPQITSVRLVTNPEKMVLRETQRAFVYFSLHGLTVDTVIVNRVLPAEVTGCLVQRVAQFAGQMCRARSRNILRPCR